MNAQETRGGEYPTEAESQADAIEIYTWLTTKIPRQTFGKLLRLMVKELVDGYFWLNESFEDFKEEL